MQYKNWTIHTTPNGYIATKDGEELTVNVTGERGLELIKNAIDRREA